MPQRPAQPCTTPGCANRHRNKGRCAACKNRQPTSTARAAHYKGDWPRLRLNYLTRHPHCALCHRLADTADHWPRSLKQLLAQGVPNPHADHRLRPLCHTCHSAATWTNQPGGHRWAHRDR